MDLRLRYARTFGERLIGASGSSLGAGEGLVFLSCRCIQTLTMHRPIDVLFMDASGCIVRICHHLPPWRIRYCADATSVIELPAGFAAAQGVRLEQVVRLALTQLVQHHAQKC